MAKWNFWLNPIYMYVLHNLRIQKEKPIDFNDVIHRYTHDHKHQDVLKRNLNSYEWPNISHCAKEVLIVPKWHVERLHTQRDYRITLTDAKKSSKPLFEPRLLLGEGVTQ